LIIGQVLDKILNLLKPKVVKLIHRANKWFSKKPIIIW